MASEAKLLGMCRPIEPSGLRPPRRKRRRKRRREDSEEGDEEDFEVDVRPKRIESFRPIQTSGWRRPTATRRSDSDSEE